MSVAETVDASTIAEMEEMISRIRSHKGVEGVMIMDRRGELLTMEMFAVQLHAARRIGLTGSSFLFYSGAIIQSTLDEEQTTTHANALSNLTAQASHIVGMLNQDDELTFLRIRSKQREIAVSI